MTADSQNVRILIKNYRCFPDTEPVKIILHQGFTSLVGVNNSGKSSLLKFFFELRGIFNSVSNHTDDFKNSIIHPQSFVIPNTIKDMEEIFCNENNRDMFVEIAVDRLNSEQSPEGLHPEKIVFQIPRNTNTWRSQIIHRDRDLTKGESSIARIGMEHIKIKDNTLVDMYSYNNAFESLSKIVYLGAFRNAVNIGGSENYYDMVIGQQFISLWDSYKSGSSKTKNKAALKLTQEIGSIFQFKSLEINASQDNQTLHIIVDDKSYRLDELGSGLAQFVVILANIAIKHPSWVLIDEPELNLHPSLQIDFLTTLASYAGKGLLFATHNIGLARACSEHIYSCRRNASNRIEVKDFEATHNLSEFLGELSYSSYNDLGFVKVLLVEGVTEVKTIQQFLRKYQKDHTVVLLSLGGSDLINSTSEAELREIKRVTGNNVYALIDSELDSPNSSLSANREQFTMVCKTAGIQCRVLKYRSIENYFSERAIKVVKGDKYRALSPYEKLKEASPSWAKQENWRIAREMIREEIEKTDLGEFLNTL